MKPGTTLQQLFAPQSVAVIGASRNPDKVGYRVLENLIKGGFEGRLYPVNPQATEVLGLQTYRWLSEVSGPVDLAVVAIPASAVLSALRSCPGRGSGAAIVLSAGFKEIGGEGAALEEASKQLVTDFPEKAALDINPLLVKPKGEGTVALDARICLERT